MLFRSSRLSELTDADRDLLSGLGITTVCDLRREDELARRPNRLDFADPLRVVHAPAGMRATGGFRALLRAGEKRVELYRRIFVEAYRELARDSHAAWRSVLEAIAESDGATVVLCNAGQDRTGAATAVVLSALGVSREAVMADYCLSAAYGPPPDAQEIHDSIRAAGLDGPELPVLIEILAPHRALLETFFETVEQDHGTMDRYLRDALGMDAHLVAALKARLLDAAP